MIDVLKNDAETAIRVEDLGKQYRLGQQQKYKSLRDTVTSALRVSRGTRSNGSEGAGVSRGRDTDLWALRNVSFEVKRGEAMGLIGRNGSGKSTLLKLLSRITEPTTGRARIIGRVGTLLEVGTGFHPELTGRENIYLNGAILGMKQTEIAASFDQIVAFAEVERFLDTAVKHYSSGMYVRLAFAVAAHLEPEILLVDEVLAVGDSAFQKKCLGKMQDVAKEGRTVLFVSHDMTNISVLCNTALLLQGGKVVQQGPARDVIDTYINQGATRRSSVTWTPEEAPGDAVARITAVSVCRPDGGESDSYGINMPVALRVDYTVSSDNYRLNPVFVVRNILGTAVFSTSNFEDPEWGVRSYRNGRYKARCIVPAHILNDGAYLVEAMLVEETRFVRARAEDAVEFTIFDDGSTRGDFVGPWEGIVRPRCQWKVEQN